MLLTFEKIEGIYIEPSILVVDFGKLAGEAKRIEASGESGIQIDIMDGHFVPNLTLGIKSGCRATTLFLDVHIMVYRPFCYIGRLSGKRCRWDYSPKREYKPSCKKK